MNEAERWRDDYLNILDSYGLKNWVISRLTWQEDFPKSLIGKKELQNPREYIETVLGWYKSIPKGTRLKGVGSKTLDALTQATGYDVRHSRERCKCCGQWVRIT